MTDSRLRVLMVTPGYPPAVGGTEIQCARLSEGLASRGAQVRVVTRGREDAPARELRAGVEVRRSRFWGRREAAGARARNAASFVTAVVGVVREVAREPGWVVHHHGLGMSLVAARMARGRRRLPIVAKVLCGGSGGECARLAADPRFAPVRWVLDDVERFVALQPAIEEELAALGVDRGRVVVLPNGVPVDGLAGPGPAAGVQGEVLFGGRLDPQKDLATLVEAWALVAPEQAAARLTIAGDGPDRAALADRVQRRGLSDSVRLPGFAADYADRLARAQVFVLPSRYEGMSNALLEAMVAARACVVTDIPENRHTLGDAGLYFPPGDARRLASHLRALLRSPAETEAWGRKARRRAADEFGLPGVISRYQDLYRCLLVEAAR